MCYRFNVEKLNPQSGDYNTRRMATWMEARTACSSSFPHLYPKPKEISPFPDERTRHFVLGFQLGYDPNWRGLVKNGTKPTQADWLRLPSFMRNWKQKFGCEYESKEFM